MNMIKRLCLIIATALTIDVFIIAPVFAQQGELATLNARVMALYRAGKFAEALPLARQVLAIREKALGPDHPNVAASLSSLADLYRIQGRYADAEPLLERALATLEKALGREHPNLGPSLNNLAALYRDQGRYGAPGLTMYRRGATEGCGCCGSNSHFADHGSPTMECEMGNISGKSPGSFWIFLCATMNLAISPNSVSRSDRNALI
jgi:Tetratricopeptide repeat